MSPTPMQILVTIQETSYRIQYGNWRGVKDVAASGGTYRVSKVGGSKIKLTFKGTSITWITLRGPDQGMARVAIDGVNQGTINLYRATRQYKYKKTFAGLADGSHTLLIKVSRNKDVNSSDTQVGVDGFITTGGVTEEDSGSVRYDNWKSKRLGFASLGSFRMNNKAGASVRLKFKGTAIEWVTATGPGYGKAEVWIDGNSRGVFDLYSSTGPSQATIPFTGLSADSHTIRVRIHGTQSRTLGTTSVVVDAFRVTALPADPTPTASSATAYWGAYIYGAPWDMKILESFENDAQKPVSIVHWSSPWLDSDGKYYPFATDRFEAVRAHGAIPMFTWGSRQQGTQLDNEPKFRNRLIAAGVYDDYIRKWATDAKNWGHPFFLRFNHEMQGWWYPWGEGLTTSGTIANGNNPGDYVKAWRHVHDIFTSVGAKNVTWVWCISVLGAGNTRYPTLASIYPGRKYVDWTCIDAYNKFPVWLNLRQVMTGYDTDRLQNTYQQVLDLAPGKPIMLGEIASIEAGDGGAKKGEWFKSALLTELPTYLPQAKAFVYFNWDDRDPAKTYPIESTDLSKKGFAAGIGSSYYAPNIFANLGPGVILPLR